VTYFSEHGTVMELTFR